MTTFALIVLIICFAIWFLVWKSDKPPSETSTQHTAQVNKGETMKNDQVQDEKKMPAATTEVVEWADRRLSERWRDWLALTTTIIAVLTVGMSLQVSQYLTLSLISQGKETNAWSYYQAQSMRNIM